ncbi:MAG: hypothetical protein CVU28_00575 [Betaproteobacteria bacterium HGW-Betaproteobacteria-21]|nr:MAG: hypothetical protein CVU28_00575 [Betaproteobacteria bacterium HGW-Betaproteobacteria-21]
MPQTDRTTDKIALAFGCDLIHAESLCTSTVCTKGARMLSAFKLKWGIDQWVAFLKDKEIPILPRTKAVISTLSTQDANARESMGVRELLSIVYADPYLSLKLLRRAEQNRSRRLGQETTTALAAMLQTGFDDLIALAAASPTTDDTLQGCNDCEFRAVIAASIARAWARQRADISPDEVTLAALLSESGELLLWHFAPELPQMVEAELSSGRAFRAVKAEQQAVGFTFKQMTLALVQAWDLPNIVALLIKGTDTPRANIARLAVDTARHIIADPRHPAIPADLINIRSIIPGAAFTKLIAPLPLADDYKAFVLEAVTENTASTPTKDLW